MDFNIDNAVHEMRTVVASKNLKQGITRLLSYCRKNGSENPSLSRLSKLPFAKDAKHIAEQLRRFAEDKKIPPKCKGFYFGIDGLNMPDGKGIEFGCSPIANPGEDVEWAQHCDVYPGDGLMSPVLSEIYRVIQGAGIYDYVFALGYSGLALRHALESIPSRVLLGGQRQRVACWGFGGGDYFSLGTLSPSGFVATVPPTQANVKALKPVLRKLPKRKGAVQWVHYSEQVALEESDPKTRATLLMDVANLYSECNDWTGVSRTLRDVSELLALGVTKADISCYSLFKDWIIRNHKKNSAKVDIRWFFGDEVDSSTLGRNAPEKTLLMKELKALLKKPILRSKAAIAQTNAAAKKLPHFDSASGRADYDLGSLLLQLYLRTNNFRAARKLRSKHVMLDSRYLDFCLAVNAKKEFKSQSEAQLRYSKSDLYNIHHKITDFTQIARIQHSNKQKREAKVTIDRALKMLRKAVERGVPPVQMCAALSSLAQLAFEMKDKESVNAFANAAVQWGDSQAKSKSSRDMLSTTYLTLAEMYDNLKDPENALLYASKIPSSDTSLNKMCSFLAKAGKDAEVLKLVAKLKTPSGKIDVFSWCVRSMNSK